MINSYTVKLWLGLAAVFAVLAAPALWPAVAPEPLAFLITLLLGAVLSLLAAIDIEIQRLPDPLTLPLILAGLAVTYALQLDDVVWRLVAAAAGYGLLFAMAQFFRRVRGIDALGMGDAKLFAASGAWLGLGGLPSVLLIASLAALLMVLVAKVRGVAIDRSTRIPFGPFLALGFWITWLYGQVL